MAQGHGPVETAAPATPPREGRFLEKSQPVRFEIKDLAQAHWSGFRHWAFYCASACCDGSEIHQVCLMHLDSCPRVHVVDEGHLWDWSLWCPRLG